MRRYFDWLVEHEKLLISVNLLLIVLLVIQLKFCRSRVDTGQTSSGFETPADSIKQVPGGSEKFTDSKTEIAGTWDMNVQKSRGGTQNWTLKLDQHGEDLTGVITSEGGDLSVTGTIKGQAINLSATRLGVTVEFTAVLNGTTMTGQMRALTIKRLWTAKRRA